MALAPAGISRISVFKAAAFDFNGGNNWSSSGCSLASSVADATRVRYVSYSLYAHQHDRGVSKAPTYSGIKGSASSVKWFNSCNQLVVLKSVAPRKHIVCSAVQESSTPTVPAETKPEKAEVKEDAKPEAKATPAKAKPAAKAPAKALPQLMEEDVIPSLRSTLEAQKDITELELAFIDNRLEGSFQQGGKPYTFWALFSDGTLTGLKGFCISSYGSEVSTVEPFLVDEKKPTSKLVVFWVEKRLAAQGIIPVWKE